jgi:hypothetical protein
MMKDFSFDGSTEWQKHFMKVAEDNPHIKTNRERQKIARELWIARRIKPPKPGKLVIPRPLDKMSDYKKFWIETAKKNPQLRTTAERDALAKKLWIASRRPDRLKKR